MIHELLPSPTETASGSHPCCVVSVTYDQTQCFHGGHTGSNPVGDAKPFNNLRALRFSRGTVISGEKRDWWVNPRLWRHKR